MKKQHSTEKHVFYVDRSRIAGDQVAFPDAEAQHLSRVLRLAPGEIVRVVDGDSGLYRVRLDAVTRNGALGKIVETLPPPDDPLVRCTVAVGLLKHAGRYETMLEKVTELGAVRIVPLLSERCERSEVKESRSHGILVAAMKQCGAARLPRLEASTRLDRFLAEPVVGLRLVCHESGPDRRPLPDVLRESLSGDVTVLVGPEGGFSDPEIARTRAAGYIPVSLGARRLRTETAAIAAVSIILSMTGR